MRVVMLHNRYRAAGGEERAVSDLVALLRDRGHDVELIERSSDEASGARAARGLLTGGLDPDQVGAAVRRLRADVVHVHNIHPLFGWRALAAARAAGARTVLQLHNFRLFCAIGVAYRDGAPCFRCRGRDTRPGLRLRCRGSLGEAAVYAAGLALQQPHLFADSDAFLCVSEASAARLAELGLPAERAHTLHNFARTSALADRSRAGEGGYALVSGRLVAEKGFDTAITAATQAGVPLVIAGDGPDRERLQQLAARAGSAGSPAGAGSPPSAEVTFTGRVDPGTLAELRRGAGVVLVPSRSEDSFPYAALDALADGVPLLATTYGGLPELAGRDGVLSPHDPGAWTARLSALWADPGLRADLGAQALERARTHFGEDAYHAGLMRVYRAAGAAGAGGAPTADGAPTTGD
jgi:glycosyltransferase involved in cell wall biosynthesis